MPRSITPRSVRITNGTDAPRTIARATSAGRFCGSAKGFTEPSVDLYDHVTFVGASQSASVAGPSPAACVVHTHGSRCGPDNTGPFFEWFRTRSRTDV